MSDNKFEQYTYEYLMQLALSFVKDDKDKRQGSVVYDCLGPFCQLLAAGALELRKFYTETYALTATGENLDNRVAEQSITRYPATRAVKKITLEDSDNNPISVPMGTRFSTVSDTNPINYTVTAQYKEKGVAVPGNYEATCEELGTIGNEYSGNIINITFIQGLAYAYMSSLLVPARDEETDDNLRERYLKAINQNAFGGNIADYRIKVMDIDGVGAVQIYPVWDGGGTVKLSIVDPQYNTCSTEFIASVQELIDPENAEGDTGAGLGIAPIGHKVTVVTPDEITIGISATLTLHPEYTIEQLEYPIKQALADYIKSLRQSWADSTDLNVYSCDVFIAQITAAIIGVSGVANVTSVLLNDEAKDIKLTQNGQVQQLPKLGEVSLDV